MPLFTTKNLTPNQISAFTAALLAVICAVLALALQEQWYYALGEGVVVFMMSFLLYRYALMQFIYRKIKLIYKLIYQTKATKKEEFFYSNILPQKSLDEVNEDVALWAKEKTKEIEILRTNEQFRKEFLMNLAHELRTPIFTAQGYVDTLLGGAMDDKAVSVKFLNNAAKSIERLANLVDDLDKISKLESGSLPLTQEVFALQVLVKEVFEELELLAAKKEISLGIKKGTEGQINVRADKAQIKQVLVNLVENGIKYGKQGGMVICGCYLLDEKNVLVEISDNGSGISEEHLPRIYERFYRADRSRNSAIGGTGLGLSIVKHIVEAHGHTVSVRSTPGVGSSFSFTLQQGKE